MRTILGINKVKKELILQKGGSEMKTMIQQKSAIRPKPEGREAPQASVIKEAPVAPEEPTMAADVAPEVKPSQGLCATCNEAPGCAYAHGATPVLFCEMFDNSTPVSDPQVDGVMTSDRPAEGCAQGIALKGLCVNCDNRHTCTFPKPEDGVWHCEEYR